MAYSNFVPVNGIIFNITNGGDCCTRMVALRTQNGIVNMMVGPETMIVDNRQLRQGMEVTAYYDGSLPVPLIFPPQYRAQMIAVRSRNEQVMLNFFDRNLLAQDQSLQLNIDRNTDIRTANGQNFNCRPENQVLLVFYTATTRSIPPQTTPRRIIVLC